MYAYALLLHTVLSEISPPCSSQNTGPQRRMHGPRGGAAAWPCLSDEAGAVSFSMRQG
jgi:hypothetical protein